ncbi:unnamed protein product, partial [Ceratitis capitata]
MGFKENCKVSLRANSTTLRVTTAIDVIIVALASIAGVGCGIFGLRSTQELNQRLRKHFWIFHTLRSNILPHTFGNYRTFYSIGAEESNHRPLSYKSDNVDGVAYISAVASGGSVSNGDGT